MASCRHIEGLLQAYIDGEVGEANRVAVEQHLGECGRCKRLHREMQRGAADLFETFESFRLREALAPRVMAHLPEMEMEDAFRDAREATYRAKHPQTRASRILRLMPVLAPLLLVILGMAIVYAWPNDNDRPGNAVGVVTLSNGGVRLHSDEPWSGRLVTVRNHVFSGQSFETDPGANMMVALAGPSEVRLDSDSLVHVRGARELHLERGRMWVHVNEEVDLFRVSTPAGNVVVFGTVFDVAVDDDKTVVTVQDGLVHVENGVASRDLAPDEQLEMRAGQRVFMARVVDASQVLSWARGMVADPQALTLFAETVRREGATNMAAEQVFVVQTNGRTVREISFEWEPERVRDGGEGYYVYVSDDQLNLLFVQRIPGTVFTETGRTSVDIAAPGAGISGVSVLHIKAVPAGESGSPGATFARVSALGI